MKNKIQHCEFIPVTDVVPEGWRDWFYPLISESAPFSWGDANRTLVDADFFRRHVESCFSGLEEEEDAPPHEELEKFLGKLRGFGQLYIDLEN
jgi:hypothetical protein